MSGPADPIRRLAQERGRLMGELGVRPEDEAWIAAEAAAIASLTRPQLQLHLPAGLSKWLRRFTRALR